MAQITFTIPDAVLPRVISSLCNYYNYQSTVTNAQGQSVPNPETQSAYAKRMIAQVMLNAIKTAESQSAQQAAIAAANANVDANITIV